MARVILTPIDMSKLEIRNMLAHVLASAPGSPVEGQLYYDSTTKTLSFRTNAAWMPLGRLDQLTAPTGPVALNAQKITGLGLATVSTDAASLANKVHDFAAPTAPLAMNSQKITGLADGTAAQDAATKGQVDAASAGLDAKPSVRVATTANGTLATAFANGQTIDGIVLATNDRILIKNQTTVQENGIYVVQAAGAPVRATDMDAWTEVPGAFAFVEVGTANADTGWVATADAGGTLNTTPIPWTKFTAAATGVQRYTQTIGDGSTTSIVVTHSLGQQWCIAQVFDVTSLEQVECDIDMTSTTTTTFIFAVAPTTNQLRVVIVG